MNHHDEELQHNIENGQQPDENNLDGRIYIDLFKTLSKPHAIDIPSNFADRILFKVIHQKELRSTRDFVWLGVGVFVLLLVCAIGFAYSGITMDLSTFKRVAGIGSLVLFALAFCGVLTYVDKKLLSGKLES